MPMSHFMTLNDIDLFQEKTLWSGEMTGCKVPALPFASRPSQGQLSSLNFRVRLYIIWVVIHFTVI